jgi:competence protein ComFC
MCTSCASQLRYHDQILTYSPGVSGHIRFFRYDGVFKNTLRGAKYFSVRQGLYDILNYVPWGKLPEALERCGLKAENSMLVPIPLHPKKQHERGFNQSEIIAAEISRKLSIPMTTSTLSRTKYTTQQARLIHAERALNIHGAFAVKRPALLHGKRVILVDDVWTTGSTIREVVRAIHHTPHLTTNKIFALTLAR